MARVDTHQLIQELIEGGLPQKPSEVIGKAFLNSSNNNDNYVTKEQFAHLEKEQSDIKTDLAVIKQTMATKEDLEKLRTEIKVEIKDIKIDLLKWMIPFFLTIIGLIITAFFKH